MDNMQQMADAVRKGLLPIVRASVQKGRTRLTRLRNKLYSDSFHAALASSCGKAKCWQTVSNKNTHLADFETCVFRGYLRNQLIYKKAFNIYLLKSFQMKKEFLKSGHKISRYFQKRCFARKK